MGRGVRDVDPCLHERHRETEERSRHLPLALSRLTSDMAVLNVAWKWDCVLVVDTKVYELSLCVGSWDEGVLSYSFL